MSSVSVTDNSFEHIVTILGGILSYPVEFFPFRSALHTMTVELHYKMHSKLLPVICTVK